MPLRAVTPLYNKGTPLYVFADFFSYSKYDCQESSCSSPCVLFGRLPIAIIGVWAYVNNITLSGIFGINEACGHGYS